MPTTAPAAAGLRLAAVIAMTACGPSLPSGEGVARVDGIDLHYVVAGTGPPLVVLPGGPGLGAAYMKMPRVERFATVVYVDPRGSGRSSRPTSPEACRMDRMVEDVEALRRALGLERIALLGHSHGGMVAQLYAAAHPAALRGLVLVGTVASAGRAWVAETRETLRARSGEPGLEDAAAAAEAAASARTEEEVRSLWKREMPLYFHRWEPFRARMEAALDAAPVGIAALRAFQELDAAVFDARPKLAGLRVPALIVAGRHDVAASVARAEELNRLLVNSRLSVFERSGHFPFIEEEEGFALAVRAFLAGR
jgi:proline-specific peptidase